MELFRFENQEYLWGLLVIPLLVILYILWRLDRKRKLRKFGETPIISQLLIDVSKYKPFIRLLIVSIAIAFLVLSIAQPQIGSRLVEFKREGIDIVIAIDVSNSMKAQDIKPDRLSRAKLMVSRLIDKLANDRIAMVVFAGDAFLQLPLTTDYGAAKLMLQTVDTDLIANQGTAIGKAIELSIKALTEDEKRSKSIIIITDGENHEDDAIGMAQLAASKGIVVHTVGIGSVNGGPIPIRRGDGTTTYLKDRDGNTVITKLDANMLQQIASAGNGSFIRAVDTDPMINDLLSSLAKLEKTEFESKLFTDYDDKFQYFLFIALILILFEFLLSDRKNKYIAQLMTFVEKQK